MSGVPRAQEWIDGCATLISRRGHRIAFRRRGQGPTVLMLHGFPTWSYDYAEVAGDLASDHDVITLDFLGYGASDKPNPYEYSVAESADVVEDLAAHLQYGGIVGQELIDRAQGGRLGFTIDSLVVLNSGIVYSAYRPTRTGTVDSAGHWQVTGRPDHSGPLPFRTRRGPRIKDRRHRVR
jgi:pimeloyl-ACP methyl ester carboxylesterase